jgi:preprotein translocase subunit SecD
LEESGLARGAQVRLIGQDRIQISLPGTDVTERLNQIQRAVVSQGSFEMLVLADREVDQHLIAVIEQAGPESKTIQKDGEIVARWVRVGRDTDGDLRVDAPNTAFHRETRAGDIEVLVLVDAKLQFHGGHLDAAYAGLDSTGNPCIRFSTTKEGAARLRNITALNLPDTHTGWHRYLGIIIDDELLTAPRITSVIGEKGEITGRFTQEEVDFFVCVLQGGRLPAPLKSEPVMEKTVSPK